MNKILGHSKVFALFLLFFSVGISFQNCSQVQFKSGLESPSLISNNCQQTGNCPQAAPTCTFNGQTYSEGDTVTAYLYSSVPTGQTCTSQTRTCVEGNFTGSYSFATCGVGTPASCLFNGQTFAHGATVKAYQNSSVAFGQTCTSEDRICTNGTLSGTYNFSTCSPGAPNSCLFNGQTIAHGASVIGYTSSSVAYGQICASQNRVCTNGTLSGSGDFASCSVGGAASCMFNGQTIAHGASIVAFQNSSVGYGQTCASQNRVCNNGTLSGSYNYTTCSSGSANSCLFNGQSVAHGQTVTAYQSSTVGYGQSCVSQGRTCNNGVLSGTYTYAACDSGAAASCMFNGQTVAHGASVTAYITSSVAYGYQCGSQTRTCSNGVLSGSYNYASCSVGTPSSCNFNGQTIANGQNVVAYAAPSVGYGQTCSQQTRTCSNGVLSGSYTYTSCSASQGASCNFNGQTVPHGGSVLAFASYSVPYGQSCQAQNRTCNNGVLSGSYQATTCSQQPAPPTNVGCNFNGQSVAHGGYVTAWAASSVPYGQSCQSENRFCNNGSLSGSYQAPSCSVGSAPPPPPPSGPTIIRTEQYCDGIGCISGCGMWERGTKTYWSDGRIIRSDITTGGANDCGGA